MNEKIKELAEQARKYASDYVADCKHYGHYMEHNELEVKFEEKFAQLIVKECMMVCGAVSGAAQLRRPNDSFGEGAEHSKQMIAKHFEIE